jgi:LemA protein
MKKGIIILLVIIVLIIIVVGWVVGKYNMMQKAQIDVQNQFAQVQAAYQRRLDLIPNLVNTVKGASNFEKSTLIAVTEARAKMGGTLQLPKEAVTDPQAFANLQQASQGLSSALSRLMVVVERYPELKANQNYLALQEQLEQTENRINQERQPGSTKSLSSSPTSSLPACSTSSQRNFSRRRKRQPRHPRLISTKL